MGGFEELEASLFKVGALLADGGSNRGKEEWGHLARFVRRFGPCYYASSEDSEVRDLRSVDSFSTQTVPETPQGGARPLGAMQLLEAEALADQELLEAEESRPVTDEERMCNEMAMRRVHTAARRAAELYRAAVDSQQGGGRTAGQASAGGVEGQQGAGEQGVLAIMDAVDQPLPSSEGSQGKVAEPKQKRRAKEVLVAGGYTGNDVGMVVAREAGASGSGGEE